MSEQADARRLRLMELLAATEEAQDLETLARAMQCDTRTIRRDLDYLQHLLQRMQGLEIRRSKVLVARTGYSPGYFTDQLGRNTECKQAIAREIVSSLPDGIAVALTAGSTTFAVAQEMRRVHVEGEHPQNLIVFTNSVPSLLELVAGGISAGVLGEIYVPDDCAFHTPEFRSAFQPGVAICGASGVIFSNANQPCFDLYSHRAEEAAFLKQLLANVPEIIVAVDSTKLGRRHPWSFGGGILDGKRIRLVTDALTGRQREELDILTEYLSRRGTIFVTESIQNCHDKPSEPSLISDSKPHNNVTSK